MLLLKRELLSLRFFFVSTVFNFDWATRLAMREFFLLFEPALFISVDDMTLFNFGLIKCCLS